MRLAKKYFHLKSNAVYNSSAKNRAKFRAKFCHVWTLPKNLKHMMHVIERRLMWREGSGLGELEYISEQKDLRLIHAHHS